MPILESSYRPRGLFKNAHASTIIPSSLRRVLAVSYVRERLETPDGDFIDLDWSRVGVRRVAVLCHGLEGNAGRPYMLGMARALNNAGRAMARTATTRKRETMRFMVNLLVAGLETLITGESLSHPPIRVDT